MSVHTIVAYLTYLVSSGSLYALNISLQPIIMFDNEFTSTTSIFFMVAHNIIHEYQNICISATFWYQRGFTANAIEDLNKVLLI